MVYNDTSGRSGIIQQCERQTDLGVGNISSSSDLLKDFTVYANETMDDLWYSVWSSMAYWQWDDSNNLDLPRATTDLVSGTGKYSIPSEALTVGRLEVKSQNGEWYKLIPYDEDRDKRALSQLEANTGNPTHYYMFDDSIVLLPTPNYSQTGSLKVYFDRGSVSFVSTDTTKEPGILKPFHGLVPLGMSIAWLSIKQPQSLTLPLLIKQYNDGKAQMEDVYSKRFGDKETILSGYKYNME